MSSVKVWKTSQLRRESWARYFTWCFKAWVFDLQLPSTGLESCFNSALFLVYFLQTPRCVDSHELTVRDRKDVFHFDIWFDCFLFVTGDRNSPKNILFGCYYYFSIWDVLTILKPWILNVVLLIFVFLLSFYKRNCPPIQTKLSPHLSDNSWPKISGPFFIFLERKCSGNIVILRVDHVNSIFSFFGVLFASFFWTPFSVFLWSTGGWPQREGGFGKWY